MRKYLLLLSLFSFTTIFSQNLTGNQLLEKAIKYHDPKNHWQTFKGELFVVMKTPNNKERESRITINLPKEYFYVKAKRDTITTEMAVHKGDCSLAINGNTHPTEALQKEYGLSCKRAKMYKNYYTFLYGLPMKLKDEGTIIQQKVTHKKFKGTDYLVLKVTYKKEVGNDIWYFYFNPKNYKLEVYQFFHNEAKNDGEYILLSEEKEINGIKMPKIRAWYTNKDNKYLGTDTLK